MEIDELEQRENNERREKICKRILRHWSNRNSVLNLNSGSFIEFDHFSINFGFIFMVIKSFERENQYFEISLSYKDPNYSEIISEVFGNGWGVHSICSESFRENCTYTQLQQVEFLDEIADKCINFCSLPQK